MTDGAGSRTASGPVIGTASGTSAGATGATTAGTVPGRRRGRDSGRGTGPRARRWAPRTTGTLPLAREAGMATAEYAIATVAAAGFAGLLVVVLRSDEVRGLLAGIVRGVLAV